MEYNTTLEGLDFVKTDTYNFDNDQFKTKDDNVQKNKNKNNFKEKSCKVISYNPRNNTLDVNFDGYGIRVKNVKDFAGSVATLKYKGEIGRSNFEYKL